MTTKRVLTLLVTVSLVALALTGIDRAIAARSNCESVRKSYPFGIALNKVSIGTSRAEVVRAKYILFEYLDHDLDGIICEIETLQTQIPVTRPNPATNLKVKRTWLPSSTFSNFMFTWDVPENWDTQFGTLIYWNATVPTGQYKISVTNLKTLTIDFQSIQPICFTILSETKDSGTLANAVCEDATTVFTTTTTTTVRRVSRISIPSIIGITPRPTISVTPRPLPPPVPKLFVSTTSLPITTTTQQSSTIALPATTTSSTCVPDSYEVSRLNSAIQPWNINYPRLRPLFVYEGRIEATRMLDSYMDAMRSRYETAMASILKCVRVYWEIIDLNSVNWPNR